MYLDVKVTIWQRISLNEDEGVTKEMVIDTIKKEGVLSLWEMDKFVKECDYIIETEKIMTLQGNGGNATVQLFDDSHEMIWDNSI